VVHPTRAFLLLQKKKSHRVRLVNILGAPHRRAGKVRTTAQPLRWIQRVPAIVVPAGRVLNPENTLPVGGAKYEPSARLSQWTQPIFDPESGLRPSK